MAWTPLAERRPLLLVLGVAACAIQPGPRPPLRLPSRSTTPVPRRDALAAAAVVGCGPWCTPPVAGAVSGTRPDVPTRAPDERFARVMAAGMADYERRDDVRRMKRALFERIPADATVAEIGVGAGVNLAYYAPTARKIVAVEPNAAFFGPASSAAARLGLQQSSFELVEGVAEAMPLADDTVDAVVGTHVLCSVTDVRRTLEEVRRVLKPGGLYVFAEHVAAPREAAMLGMAQRMADPLQVCCAGGCHLRRDHAATLAAVFADPSDRLELHRFMLDGVGPAPPWPPHFLLAPHLCGVATKAGGERRRPTSVVSSLEAAITAANTA